MGAFCRLKVREANGEWLIRGRVEAWLLLYNVKSRGQRVLGDATDDHVAGFSKADMLEVGK